ncbi:hypothetical protein FS837_001599 [Tulasnella sp. UAMH 9824]|nr:hypothetical protein FS837_001599 [Tulasnella sp. UAMH 9824]
MVATSTATLWLLPNRGPAAALVYTCGTCKYQRDTTQYAALQQEIDQYVANCAANNSPVGALPIPYCSAPATA